MFEMLLNDCEWIYACEMTANGYMFEIFEMFEMFEMLVNGYISSLSNFFKIFLNGFIILHWIMNLRNTFE